MEEKRYNVEWNKLDIATYDIDNIIKKFIGFAEEKACGVEAKLSLFYVIHNVFGLYQNLTGVATNKATMYISYINDDKEAYPFGICSEPDEDEYEKIYNGSEKVWRLEIIDELLSLSELVVEKLAEPKYFKKVEYEVKLEKRETVYVMVECDVDGDLVDNNDPEDVMDYYLDNIASKFADDISENDLVYTFIDDGYGNIMTAEDAQCDVGDCINEDDIEFEEEEN